MLSSKTSDGVDQIATSHDSKNPASAQVQEQSSIDSETDSKLLRKCDFTLLPILSLMYLCSFLDRGNIGNAAIQGLPSDLHLKGSEFNVALFSFFILYIPLEVPANIILKHVRPSIWLGTLMLCWGIVTMCQGFTQSYAGLVVCRVLLGAFEAGFSPGCIYLISMYYKRFELFQRIGIFYSASVLASAFSGLLAYAIAYLDGKGGYAGWRWIFILEGLFTVVIAALSFWMIPDWPETAKFLTADERKRLILRLSSENDGTRHCEWSLTTAKQCMMDIKVWLCGFLYFCMIVTSYSGAYFFPTILKELGWTSSKAQVMSIPIWMTAMVILVITAVLSDRLRRRYPFVVLGSLTCIIGYCILLNAESVPVGARYFALYLVASGAAMAQPTILVWAINNLDGHYERGIGIAIQTAIGNLGGFVASNVYLKSQAPRYPLGYGVGLGFMVVLILVATVLVWRIRYQNRSLSVEKGVSDSGQSEERSIELKHARPLFIY